MWNRKDLPVLARHSKTELLESIIGVDSPGLLPGGKAKDADAEWAGRAQIHCSTTLMKNDEIIQDKFRRRDIDCCIRLDPQALFHAGFQIFISDANVALIAREVPVEYIQHVPC